MRQNAEPQGRGQKRPFWFDPRFTIGLVLVVGSISGVYAVVASVDDSVQVYAARATLPAGTSVSAADLDVTSVRLGAHEARYLVVADLPDEGAVLTRAVAKGELIPTAAVSERADVGLTTVVVSLSGEVAEAVAPGARVDLWGAEQLEHGRHAPPLVVVSSAEVVRTIEEGGFIGNGGGRSVELQLPAAKVADVLQAIANGDALSLVPASVAIEPAKKAGAAPTATPVPTAPSTNKAGE